MIKAHHSSTPEEIGKKVDFTSRDRSRTRSARERKRSSADHADGERDEDGKFKDWPVAGTVFD